MDRNQDVDAGLRCAGAMPAEARRGVVRFPRPSWWRESASTACESDLPCEALRGTCIRRCSSALIGYGGFSHQSNKGYPVDLRWRDRGTVLVPGESGWSIIAWKLTKPAESRRIEKPRPIKRARFELGAKWRWSRPCRNLTALLALLLRWFLGGSFLLGFLSRLLRRFLLRGGFGASAATGRSWRFRCGRFRSGFRSRRRGRGYRRRRVCIRLGQSSFFFLFLFEI